MILDAVSRLWRPPRQPFVEEQSPERVVSFIESRALAYPSKLEDDFVQLALALGVESGMVLDIGTRVGLTLLKLLWQNENFVGIGMDSSGLMIDRARETAAAWELNDRAVFQVGDARSIRFKENYFDLVISDTSLHRFDNAVAVLSQINKVLKPKGALLIRDLRRPNRLAMAGRIAGFAKQYGKAMEPELASSIRSAYTKPEIEQAIRDSGMLRVEVQDSDADHLILQRHGQTDPNSWVIARDQYR